MYSQKQLLSWVEALRNDVRADNAAVLPPDLERLYVTLCTVVEPMLRGEPPGQGFDLTKVCTQTPIGEHAHVIDAVARLLDAADEACEPDRLRPLRTHGFDLVLSAAVVARTPQASIPT